MNKSIMTGRLTKDPEFKTLSSGTEICNFSIAVDRRFKKEGQPTADFFNCVAFGKTGTFVNNYFTKGKSILVEGSVQNRSWDDDSGQKHYITEIIADNVEFCGAKESSENTNANTNQNYTPEPNDDDELPF